MTAPTWPKTLEIPPGAVSQWRALREALAVREPPCSFDPELWHSRAADDIAAASDACRYCHAFTACDSYATAANERSGVWAGHDRSRRPTPSRSQKETRCQD